MYSHSSNHFSPPIAPRHLARHSRMGCLHLHVYAIARTCMCNQNITFHQASLRRTSAFATSLDRQCRAEKQAKKHNEPLISAAKLVKFSQLGKFPPQNRCFPFAYCAKLLNFAS